MIVRLKDESARKIVRYVGGAALLLIIASFLYQWKNDLVIDHTERVSFGLVLITFISTFFPIKQSTHK
ncbi:MULTISPECIES: hypothetical protein [Bacillus]|uniref:Uncharacterized protein n=3 Tax=Bacillus cereus group TaxID=86661 RepID=R8QE70_BACCE|nr:MULTISPECIES: hypothetical protein [Bacillus cereus group]EJQ51454.1 hypothetical protein IEQ_02394 [Bacillus cereus BAG6X1-2]EJQ95064.1 hypothetical protein II3_04695 [Bacillus cereus MC67]EOP11224.1 hypothetical protein II1_03689 [Bacillus cereus MC118]EOP69406.1 hypothetical protein IIQ_01708 [Bacillus cereus VD118]MBJ8005289.1 hypothetical protein [Bacillus cereus]